MSIDQRLSRLAPALTAQERAILVLESWKDGKSEDPAWRRSMPPDQTYAFNRYIEQMNQANVVLGRVIGVIHAQAEKLELRWCWLLALRLWQQHTDEIGRAVRLAVKEPITESDYAARLAEAREEWVPVEDLAAFLAGYRDDWTEDDYEETEEWGRSLTDAAWDRAVIEEEKKLRALAAAGTLPSRGKGKALKLQEAAVEYFGHNVGVASEDTLSFRVVPDEQAEAVEPERASLRILQTALDWRSEDGDDDPEFLSLPDKLREGLSRSLAFQLMSSWVELRSIDAMLVEIGDAFNGADPLRPVFRTKLEATREKLLSTKENLLTILRMDVVLREPLDEELQEMRDFLASVPATP